MTLQGPSVGARSGLEDPAPPKGIRTTDATQLNVDQSRVIYRCTLFNKLSSAELATKTKYN